MSVAALPSSRLFDSDRLLGERTFHCAALPVFRPRQHWRECISKLAWHAEVSEHTEPKRGDARRVNYQRGRARSEGVFVLDQEQ